VAAPQEDAMKKYIGERTIDGISVLVDGKPLSPRYDVLKLTDYGFEWSYEGPEPSQLAFAILFDHLGDTAAAKSLYRSFMERVVANFDNDWEMTSADIDAAIDALRDHRAA
jgi:Family of unknown function (DUF6166)